MTSTATTETPTINASTKVLLLLLPVGGSVVAGVVGCKDTILVGGAHELIDVGTHVGFGVGVGEGMGVCIAVNKKKNCITYILLYVIEFSKTENH